MYCCVYFTERKHKNVTCDLWIVWGRDDRVHLELWGTSQHDCFEWKWTQQNRLAFSCCCSTLKWLFLCCTETFLVTHSRTQWHVKSVLQNLKCVFWVCVSGWNFKRLSLLRRKSAFSILCSHLADTFIQSNLQLGDTHMHRSNLGFRSMWIGGVRDQIANPLVLPPEPTCIHPTVSNIWWLRSSAIWRYENDVLYQQS